MLIVALMVIFYDHTTIAYAQKSLKEIRAQREEVKNELSDKEAEVYKLVDEMKEINIEIQALDETLEQNEKALQEVRHEKNEVQEEIDVYEKKIAERFEILNERMKSYQHIGGNLSYLEVILGAKSFTDFISRLHAVTQITDSDAALITEQRKDKEHLDVKMKELDDLEAEFEEIEQLTNEQKEIATEMKKDLEKKNDELRKIVQQLKKEDHELAELEAEIFEDTSKITAQMISGNGLLGWPSSSGYISSYYGQRWGKLHKGIDIARTNRSSSPAILAAEDGIVEEAGFHQRGYGNRVIIDHGNGLKTMYAHLASLDVEAGQKVERGEKIGVMGRTGSSTGIHLHFEVIDQGEERNPLPYLR